MTRICHSLIASAALALSGGLLAAGCAARGSAQEDAGAPPPAVVESIEAGGRGERRPSGTLSARRGRAVCDAVRAERDRRGHQRRVQRRSGDVPGLRPCVRHARAAGRRGAAGAAPDAGEEPGHLSGLLGLSARAGRRDPGAGSTRALQTPVRRAAPSPRRISKSRRTPRTRRWSTCRRPRHICRYWAWIRPSRRRTSASSRSRRRCRA